MARASVEQPPAARIVLYGRLRKRFGREFNISCSTPAMGIYALTRTIPGFEQELARGQYRVIRGTKTKGLDLEPALMHFALAGHDLHLIPVARGRKDAGSIIKIVLGVVLIGLAAAPGLGLGIGSAGGFLGAGTLGGVSTVAIGFVGVGLLLTGIGGLLSHVPKKPNPYGSFLLSGPVNTVAQGGPVPLVYGTLIRVGSTVISAGYQAIKLVPGQYESSGTMQTSGTFGESAVDGFLPNQTGLNGRNTAVLTAVAVYQPGVGYTHATVTLVPTNGGSGAAAHAVISGGGVTDIVIDNPGAGYFAAPSVVIVGDGTGAYAIATVTAT